MSETDAIEVFEEIRRLYKEMHKTFARAVEEAGALETAEAVRPRFESLAALHRDYIDISMKILGGETRGEAAAQAFYTISDAVAQGMREIGKQHPEANDIINRLYLARLEGIQKINEQQQKLRRAEDAAVYGAAPEAGVLAREGGVVKGFMALGRLFDEIQDHARGDLRVFSEVSRLRRVFSHAVADLEDMAEDGGDVRRVARQFDDVAAKITEFEKAHPDSASLTRQLADEIRHGSAQLVSVFGPKGPAN
jgi:hypothetical protein